MKRYYSVKSVGSITDDERDLTLYDDLFPGWDDDSPEAIIDESNNEGTPIPVDVLIGHLQKLKDKGANYIAMYHHCDHYGYEMEGLNIYVSTPEEVLQYEKTNALREFRNKEIEAAVKYVHDLKNKPL